LLFSSIPTCFAASSGFVTRGFESFGIFFGEDVGELGGVEDLAAKLTLDELDVLLAGDDSNLGMFARSRHRG
jgi:hypothetical protein